MQRYFIEVAYKGTQYHGFQIQQNARTIQSELEAALQTLFRTAIPLTGSSRTDAGVHAFQNYFHFDFDTLHAQAAYKLNAILPPDIVVHAIHPVAAEAHCRFDATGRQYQYTVYQVKNPFLRETGYYVPYTLDHSAMQAAAQIIHAQTNFQSFSKAHTQVANHLCAIEESVWTFEKDQLIYTVSANRFLRGMVRMLTAAMLRVGRRQLSIDAFQNYFSGKERSAYAAPAQGLALTKVHFKSGLLP